MPCTSSSFCFELSCVMAVVTAQVDVLLLQIALSISCRHKKMNRLELVYQHKNAHYLIDLRCYHVYFLKLVAAILPLKTSK